MACKFGKERLYCKEGAEKFNSKVNTIIHGCRKIVKIHAKVDTYYDPGTLLAN